MRKPGRFGCLLSSPVIVGETCPSFPFPSNPLFPLPRPQDMLELLWTRHQTPVSNVLTYSRKPQFSSMTSLVGFSTSLQAKGRATPFPQVWSLFYPSVRVRSPSSQAAPGVLLVRTTPSHAINGVSMTTPTDVAPWGSIDRVSW